MPASIAIKREEFNFGCFISFDQWQIRYFDQYKLLSGLLAAKEILYHQSILSNKSKRITYIIDNIIQKHQPDVLFVQEADLPFIEKIGYFTILPKNKMHGYFNSVCLHRRKFTPTMCCPLNLQAKDFFSLKKEKKISSSIQKDYVKHWTTSNNGKLAGVEINHPSWKKKWLLFSAHSSSDGQNSVGLLSALKELHQQKGGKTTYTLVAGHDANVARKSLHKQPKKDLYYTENYYKCLQSLGLITALSLDKKPVSSKTRSGLQYNARSAANLLSRMIFFYLA